MKSRKVSEIMLVGSSIYADNSWDWVIALPVSEVNPNYHP